MRIECDQDQVYEFDPAATALVCIDFQRDFLIDAGFSASAGMPVGKLRRVLPAARRVLEAARGAGLTIVHTRESYAPDLSNLNAFRRARDTVIGATGPLGRFLIRGEGGTAIVPEMAPRDSELTIDKPGFNAFHDTPLDHQLRTRGISRLLLMGITTQVCVASTLRGAVDHGYFPLMIGDCCAAWDDRDHDASLRVVFSENHQFGWVSDSLRVLRSLED